MPIRSLLLSALLTLTALPAHAEGFDNATELTLSSLSAAIANAHVTLTPALDAAYGGNVVGPNAFNDLVGLVTLSQNTGANAIIQQSVNVNIDQLVFTISD